MNLKTACLALMLLSGMVPAICSAQEFSADVVYMPAGNSALGGGTPAMPVRDPSRLFVGKDRMRLETRGTVGTVLLVNRSEQIGFALLPVKKEYELLAGGLAEYFQVADAENACPDWQKAAGQQIDCEKIGPGLVNGRRTVKYRNKGGPSDAAVSSVWIDSALKFTVKWETATSGAELRNIQEAPQPAEIFTIPSDYDISRPRKGMNKGFASR